MLKSSRVFMNLMMKICDKTPFFFFWQLVFDLKIQIILKHTQDEWMRLVCPLISVCWLLSCRKKETGHKIKITEAPSSAFFLLYKTQPPITVCTCSLHLYLSHTPSYVWAVSMVMRGITMALVAEHAPSCCCAGFAGCAAHKEAAGRLLWKG